MSMVGKRVEATPVLKAPAKEPPELVTELPLPALKSSNASRISPTLKLDGGVVDSRLSGRCSPDLKGSKSSKSGSTSPRPMAARGTPSGSLRANSSETATLPASRTATRPISAKTAKTLALTLPVEATPQPRPATAPALTSTGALTPTLGGRNNGAGLTPTAPSVRPLSGGSRRSSALQPSPFARTTTAASGGPSGGTLAKAVGLMSEASSSPRFTAAPPLTPAPPRRTLSFGQPAGSTPLLRRTSSANASNVSSQQRLAQGPLTVDPPARPIILRSASLPAVGSSSLPSLPGAGHPTRPSTPIVPQPPASSCAGNAPSPRAGGSGSSPLPSPVPSPPSPASGATSGHPRIRLVAGSPPSLASSGIGGKLQQGAAGPTAAAARPDSPGPTPNHTSSSTQDAQPAKPAASTTDQHRVAVAAEDAVGANPAEVSGAERSDERASAAAPVSGQESPTLSVEPSMTELGIGATGETGAELSASSSTGPPASPPRVPHRLDFMTGAPLLEISTSLGSSARHSGGRSPVSPSSAWLSAAAAHGHSGPTSPGGLRSPHQRLTIDIPPQRAGSPQEASRTLDWSVSSPSSTGLHAVPIQLQRLRQRRMLQQQRELAHVALRPLPPLPPHLPDPSTECMHDLLVDASDTAVCFGVDLAWMCDMLSTAGSRSSQELAAP